MIDNSGKTNELISFNPKNQKRKAIIVAGATASGKTALAVALAQRVNGVVINADSMQVYRDVPILTALPTVKEQGGVAHKLFGFLPPEADFNVAAWLRLAANEIETAFDKGKTPVIVGGTGLYFDVLTNGVNFIPDIPESVRCDVRARFKKIGRDAFLSEYLAKDPTFPFSDAQRLQRAAEVFEATGKTVGYFHARPKQKAVKADFYALLLAPDRATLYERCDKRFDSMIRNPDVFEQVRALFAQNPPENASVLKAVGVRELKAYLDGETDLASAVETSKRHTRNYAKRQTTWFTHRFTAQKTVSNVDFDEILTNVLRFL